MSALDGTVRVGKVRIDLGTATEWVSRYTDSSHNLSSNTPYAFPAYDRYDGGTDQPDRLTDADLLAPTLLNVAVKIRSFYALQRIRPRLEDALGDELLDRDLSTLTDDEITASIAPLYSVLDDESPWRVQETTLSKVLHRKRPRAVVLHDQWVRKCYLRTDRVPRVPERSSADYMVQISKAVRDDLRGQPEAFAMLAAVGTEARSLTPTRLLDILAWRSQGGMAAGSWKE